MMQIPAEFQVFKSESVLNEKWRELLEKAKVASANAYAPYSNYKVGAAVMLDNGEVISGCNQENAAYPSGLCAERVSFFAAAAQHPGVPITMAAVVARKSEREHFHPAAPCGSCRQVMLEYEIHQGKSIPLLMVYENSQFIISPSIANLMPLSFNKFNLE